jgi:drug/metabolite transporter (DMT)-like permease
MCILGFFFVGGFYIASLTVQYFGLAISSVAQRMSLVISVSFAILFFNEPAPITKILGILTALSSVICINIPTKTKEGEAEPILDNSTIVAQPKAIWIYPLAIFLISGIIEVILQYTQKTYNLAPSMQCILLFGSASIIGSVTLLVALVSKKIKLEGKNIIGGIAVGIPNYFSIYFLLLALQQLDGSVVYPVSNILIVGSAALLGYFVFKEKLSTVNILGVVLALLSIFLITFN